MEQFIERFSSWSCLKRVFAWILHYKSNLRLLCQSRKQNRSDCHSSTGISPISLAELIDAESAILKLVQASCFKDELSRLQNKNGNNSVSNTCSIAKLDPMLVDGLIRVGSHLQRAQIDSDTRHPIIFPKNHSIVNLITKFYHHVSGHSGLEYTLSLIRERFWVIKARPTVQKILSGCVSCRKQQAPAAEQKMASLPPDHTTPGKLPFSFTGVDCFGPFEVRHGQTRAKRYGLIFTCVTTQAVHNEVANLLDTESFINAYEDSSRDEANRKKCARTMVVTL